MNFFTIILIIILILIALFTEAKKDEKKPLKSINYEMFYKKDYVMTQAELKFYRELKEITNELELTIFPQVDLERIVGVKNNVNAYRNRIKSRSIDDVIVNNKNKLFQSIGINLYRYNLNSNKQTILTNIKESM